jgi:hypothetical protein
MASAGQVKARDDASGWTEFVMPVAGLLGVGGDEPYAERLDVALSFRRDRHAAVSAFADDEDFGIGGECVCEVLDGKTVALLSPPTAVHLIGINDDIGTILSPVNGDAAKAVVVDHF